MGKIRQKLTLDIIRMADLRFHTNMPRWYRRVLRMSAWTPSQIMEWQNNALRKLLNTAYNHSVYYRELFDSLKIKPSDIRALEDLKVLPILTKDIISERFDDILLDNSEAYHFESGSTGGSSGVPLKYIKDNDSWGFDNAFLIHMWQSTGYYYGDKYLALGSSSILPENKASLIHNLFYKLKGKVAFNAMNVSDEVMEKCLRLVKEKKIHYIYGYASSLYMLAKYVIKHKAQDLVDIRACFPTSEILTDVYYNTIKAAFNCAILDGYGAHDGGVVGFKLNRDGGFKVGYNSLVEVNSLSQEDPDFGNILVTDLTNIVFPFIRYDLGDVVRIGHGYNNYHNGQVLEQVVGRNSDVIELENGNILTCPGFTILFKDLHIRGYRFFKLEPMEIIVEIVKDNGFDKKEEGLVISTVKRYAGEDCDVKIVYADNLVRRENGKMFYFEK